MIEVKVSRVDKFWLIEIPCIKAMTQAKRLNQIGPMIVDLYEAHTGTVANPRDFKILMKSEATAQQCLASHVDFGFIESHEKTQTAA